MGLLEGYREEWEGKGRGRGGSSGYLFVKFSVKAVILTFPLFLGIYTLEM
jgi:hypothetical protein